MGRGEPTRIAVVVSVVALAGCQSDASLDDVLAGVLLPAILTLEGDAWVVKATNARGPAFLDSTLIYASNGSIWQKAEGGKPELITPGRYADALEGRLAVAATTNLTILDRASPTASTYEFPEDCRPDHKPAISASGTVVGFQCGRTDVAGDQPDRKVGVYGRGPVAFFDGHSPWSDGVHLYFIAESGLMRLTPEGPELWQRGDADAADSDATSLVTARTNWMCSSSTLMRDGRVVAKLSERFIDDVAISPAGVLAIEVVGGPTRPCQWSLD